MFTYTEEELGHLGELLSKIHEMNMDNSYYDPEYWRMYLAEDPSLQETIDELDCGCFGGEELV